MYSEEAREATMSGRDMNVGTVESGETRRGYGLSSRCYDGTLSTGPMAGVRRCTKPRHFDFTARVGQRTTRRRDIVMHIRYKVGPWNSRRVRE